MSSGGGRNPHHPPTAPGRHASERSLGRRRRRSGRPRYPERVSLRSLPHPAAQRARHDAGRRRVQRHPGGGHPGPGLRAGRPGPPGLPAAGAGGHPDRGRRRAAGPRPRGVLRRRRSRRRASGRVEVFPAWETLPFERVSPDVSTMGRRLRLLWQLGAGPTGGGGAPRGRRPAGPDIVVAPIKAVLQRLGPWRTAARPVVVAKGDRVDVDELVVRLVAMGYRRESIVEHRGRVGRAGRDRRRLPVHRRRAGPHRPVGGRGRPAHPVRRGRPAFDRRRRDRSSSSAAGSW
jgi:hypothetical protein